MNNNDNRFYMVSYKPKTKENNIQYVIKDSHRKLFGTDSVAGKKEYDSLHVSVKEEYEGCDELRLFVEKLNLIFPFDPSSGKSESQKIKELNSILENKVVKTTRYLTEEEAETLFGDKDQRAVVVLFKDGSYIIPGSENEGSRAGTLITSFDLDFSLSPISSSERSAKETRK